MPYVSEWGVKAHFSRSTNYIASLNEGVPWRCRLGCEHDTFRLLLSSEECPRHRTFRPKLLTFEGLAEVLWMWMLIWGSGEENLQPRRALVLRHSLWSGTSSQLMWLRLSVVVSFLQDLTAVTPCFVSYPLQRIQHKDARLEIGDNVELADAMKSAALHPSLLWKKMGLEVSLEEAERIRGPELCK